MDDAIILEENIHKNRLLIVGKLAATLSHEIRSPLSVLKLNLHYLNTYETDFSDEVKESLEACIESTNRIQYLIESILEFSKKSLDNNQECSVNQLIKKALGLVNKIAANKHIIVNDDCSKDIPIVVLECNKLLQVIINLLTNAIEASNEKSTVIISSSIFNENSKDYIKIEVQDFGVGMTECQKKQIFQDFFTSKKEGTGLGLSVCKSIMNEFNGDITFESKLGEGTKFIVFFPINTNNL